MSDNNTAKTHKVYADIDLCCGYGVCNQICPEIYHLNEDGIVELATDTVPEELLESATEGAACCPAQVLKIVSE
ncbi:MAG: ferredoxin [Gammaproteobacteria bacterium]|uniref:ferredoxin n=1 Tax=Pseudomaricurvus alcaniphilus TaxID=1166482 RepID=UPI001407A852|nr:ferredoxin [Pseudomaricurvus alcaniphilus]MBR9909337.1 ferredoxin [Gammaproteobacteria bacterium]NHN38273.1 ferredoxin [Pseudomaricurvus alcaniphilus]